MIIESSHCPWPGQWQAQTGGSKHLPELPGTWCLGERSSCAREAGDRLHTSNAQLLARSVSLHVSHTSVITLSHSVRHVPEVQGRIAPYAGLTAGAMLRAWPCLQAPDVNKMPGLMHCRSFRQTGMEALLRSLLGWPRPSPVKTTTAPLHDGQPAEVPSEPTIKSVPPPVSRIHEAERSGTFAADSLGPVRTRRVDLSRTQSHGPFCLDADLAG